MLVSSQSILVKEDPWEQFHQVKSLVPGRCVDSFINVISEHMLLITFLGTCEIALRWLPQNTFDSGNDFVSLAKKP